MGAERKRRRLEAEEGRALTSRAFIEYGRTIKMVPSCMDLVLYILTADDDWQVVIQNLSKALAVWRRMMRILSREGANPQVSVFFFLSVAKSILLFGADMLVVTPVQDGSCGIY